MTGHESYENLIFRLPDGDLSDEESAALREHLHTCPDCRRLFEAIAAVTEELDGDVPLPDGLHERVMTGVRAAVKAPTSRRAPWRAVAAIAAAFVLAAGGLFAARDRLTAASAAAPKAAVEYAVAAAEADRGMPVPAPMEAAEPAEAAAAAEATAEALKAANIRRVGLLGTKYTMTQDFYKDVLVRAGIEVLIPEGGDIEAVNSVIYDELCLGNIREESRRRFTGIIDRLKERGAEGVILGCTEIGLLIRQDDSALPVFDTTLIHAEQAALRAIKA